MGIPRGMDGPARRCALAVAVAMESVLIVSACSAGSTAPKPSPTPKPTPTASLEPPTPTVLAPLRGTAVTPGSLDHASIAAKIDNHPAARPQVGLESTDLIFEELVEGGLTRYVALWHSEVPDLIGPVRSIRPMDPDILSPFGGIVCYSGGQQRFVELMRHTPVYNAIHGQPDTRSTFYRTKSKAAPHNVLVKANELLKEHPQIAAPAQQFEYSADLASSSAAHDGTPSTVVSYRFSAASQGSWAYDASRRVFLRAQSGKPDLDASGAQLSAANVVVLRVGVDNSLGVPKTLLIGSGEAWVSSGGRTLHAIWSKQSATDPIHLVDAVGVAVALAPGNTWIEMIPAGGGVQFTAP